MSRKAIAQLIGKVSTRSSIISQARQALHPCVAADLHPVKQRLCIQHRCDVIEVSLLVTWLCCVPGFHPESGSKSAEYGAGHARVLLERARHHADAVQANL